MITPGEWLQLVGLVIVVVGGYTGIRVQIASLKMELQGFREMFISESARIERDVLRLRETIDRRHYDHNA